MPRGRTTRARASALKHQEFSRWLGSLVDAQPNECFLNACVALLQMEAADAVYVEGFVALPGEMRAWEHGWLQQGDEVIDPTPLDGDAYYFFGLSRTDEELRFLLNRGELFPLYPRIGPFDSERVTWNDARAAAQEMIDAWLERPPFASPLLA